MNKLSLFLSFTFLVAMFLTSCQKEVKTFVSSDISQLKAPSYPLVTIDPYTSAWSNGDLLYGDAVRHWTGKVHSLIGAIRVDGEVFRFLGKEEIPMKAVLPMAEYGAWKGQYTFEEPNEGWKDVVFDDSGWKTGEGAFGTPNMPELHTLWETQDIWVRRNFTISELSDDKVYLVYSHDDIFELYLNGHQLVETGYSWKNNVKIELDRSLLNKDGENVIAAHCHNRVGGGYVDFGIFQDNTETEIFPKTAVQIAATMSATQTQYEFECGPIQINVQFVAPLTPDDLDLLSRPINYINYQVKSLDGKNHYVQMYFETTPQWAVNGLAQEVNVEIGDTKNVKFVQAGTVEQNVLGKKGDDIRIDWGYQYLAAPNNKGYSTSINDYFNGKKDFANNGEVHSGDINNPVNMSQVMPAMGLSHDLGNVSAEISTGYVMIGYDDIEAIQYFGDNLVALWKHGKTPTITQAFDAAVSDYESVMKKCLMVDRQIMQDALTTGGKNYADLCILAFRQSIAAHKLVKDKQDNLLFLSKENFSNGSIGTVDVTYPSAPLYLKYNPELLKGMLNPIFYYSESGKWNKPFAAHDVGTYPLANGQTYGGDMPVEECGNMLILTAAIAHVEGNADYAQQHWDVLTTWANYLKENGLDPENQLCTDDFAGHFAHNTNLSIKAIMGIAGYGTLANTLGKTDIADEYLTEARRMADEWIAMADDGDHFRLTFDKPGTWSQKYNLVWDKLLDFCIFSQDVAEKEIDYYLKKQNTYGLPLDNRATYTKSDWIVWTATLSNDQKKFEILIDPLHKFLNETPDRVPMTDWYQTNSGKKVGFQARSVVGGYFIKMLE
nr:DUF4965 domain-containing protein [uncultured Carboxylicivirga sp.]